MPRRAPDLTRCPVHLGSPFDTTQPHCPVDLQPIMFEGQLSLAAAVAGHLELVHGLSFQTAWRMANRTVEAGE